MVSISSYAQESSIKNDLRNDTLAGPDSCELGETGDENSMEIGLCLPHLGPLACPCSFPLRAQCFADLIVLESHKLVVLFAVRVIGRQELERFFVSCQPTETSHLGARRETMIIASEEVAK